MNRTSLVAQPDRNRIIRDLSENRDGTRQDLSENQTSFVSGQDTRLVRKQDETRQDLSENQTSFGPYKEGNKKKKEQSMHASMPERWTELFIGQCARRSGLTGLRSLHLQERPRSRNGPIPSVYDSVSAYIEREGRAPPEDIAGWLADELHYTLMYDPGLAAWRAQFGFSAGVVHIDCRGAPA